MKLSRDEDMFLRHWMYDEVHYLEGTGLAKRLQLKHGAIPADLAVIIAAAFPEISDQVAAGSAPPQGPPQWPWSEETLKIRLAEAREVLRTRIPNAGIEVGQSFSGSKRVPAPQ